MVARWLRSLVRTASDRRGVTAAEYAILAVGVVIIVGAAVVAFKQPLIDAFLGITNQIQVQQNTVASR